MESPGNSNGQRTVSGSPGRAEQGVAGIPPGMVICLGLRVNRGVRDLEVVKIQQPVTTSTYTKYGQRYWRQPATKTQNKRNLDKRDSDSFPQHNKEGTCR